MVPSRSNDRDCENVYSQTIHAETRPPSPLFAVEFSVQTVPPHLTDAARVFGGEAREEVLGAEVLDDRPRVLRGRVLDRSEV